VRKMIIEIMENEIIISNTKYMTVKTILIKKVKLLLTIIIMR